MLSLDPNGGLSIDVGYLESKLTSLDAKYGHFLRYEKSLVGLKDRMLQYIREQAQLDAIKQPKAVLVVEINKFYKSSTYSFNMNKLNDFASQLKAKFQTARILKFDPYVLKNTIVAWPKKANSFVFYKSRFPSHLLHQNFANQHNQRGNQTGGKL